MSNTPLFVTNCIICDSEIPIYSLGHSPKVCKECRDAVVFAKKKLKATKAESFDIALEEMDKITGRLRDDRA